LDAVDNECKNKNIKVLTRTYKSNLTKMHFECLKCGYDWYTRFSNIKNLNQGCPKCANCVKYTIGDVDKECVSKNIKLLTRQYVNAHANMEFECLKCNFKWNTNFDRIHNGNTGCPECSSCKTEKYTINIAKKLLGQTFIKDNKLLGNRLQCDGVNHFYKIIIEYNGIQHYRFFLPFHKTEKDFIKQQERDKLKVIRAKEKGYTLIVVPYLIKQNNIESFLISEFIKCGLKDYIIQKQIVCEI
jgi:hypothetical protein